jgi:hypothetical protein
MLAAAVGDVKIGIGGREFGSERFDQWERGHVEHRHRDICRPGSSGRLKPDPACTHDRDARGACEGER